MATEPSPRPTKSLLRRCVRRVAYSLAAFGLFYAAFLLLGFVPAPGIPAAAPDEACIRVFVRSNGIHTDLVLPVLETEVVDEPIDWRDLFPPAHFRSDVASSKYVAIGWGNRRFFVETERWSDVRAGTLLGAVLPSETVLHVEYLQDVVPSLTVREVCLTRQQYEDMAHFVKSSVGGHDERHYAVLATDRSYNSRDRFYSATGSYHLFNNCNQWTGRGLQQAGVPTGIWTPLVPHVTCWLD